MEFSNADKALPPTVILLAPPPPKAKKIQRVPVYIPVPVSAKLILFLLAVFRQLNYVVLIKDEFFI